MIKISSNIKKECSKKYTRILIKMYLMQHQEFCVKRILRKEKKNILPVGYGKERVVVVGERIEFNQQRISCSEKTNKKSFHTGTRRQGRIATLVNI